MVQVRGGGNRFGACNPGRPGEFSRLISGPGGVIILIEGGMTALPNVMATRDWVLTTAQALERALRQAEFDRPAADSAPFFSCASSCNRTNTYSKLGQTATRISDGSRYRRLAGGITVAGVREGRQRAPGGEERRDAPGPDTGAIPLRRPPTLPATFPRPYLTVMEVSHADILRP
jgi:hypothetical protein